MIPLLRLRNCRNSRWPFKVAVWAAIIEHFAERMRLDIDLPDLSPTDPPADPDPPGQPKRPQRGEEASR